MHTKVAGTPLFEGANWTFDLIRRTYDEIEKIALGEFGLSVYPNQIELITWEQMLDRYASNGLPFMYRHWSFGKHFAQHETLYRKGMKSLAYEIVINTNPCIVHLMEENSMTMQALTIAHAAFGHNHFFKNNHLFRQWTDAKGILSYLMFARDFIAKCEEKHGTRKVEKLLDSAHALQNLGVDRAKRAARLSFAEEEKRMQARLEDAARAYNDLWRSLPTRKKPETEEEQDKRRRRLNLPEENILYFLEKHAPKLEPWQREVVRIVRNIAQYFYPQRQTQVMNEGCATFVHYQAMNRLRDKGLVTEGSMLEFLGSHTGVVFQPGFNDPNWSGGMNPYALGFAMMRDIERIAVNPTPEDRQWFRDFAGKGDPWGVLKHAWENFRDEDFILQYLSPKVIRDFKLFSIYDAENNDELLVNAIHNERGYRSIRRALAGRYDIAEIDPDICIEDVDLEGNRTLTLHHRVSRGVCLDEDAVKKVLVHLAALWGYTVVILEVDENGTAMKEHHIG